MSWWWWRRRSLRAQLTAAAVIVIALGMAGAGALLLWRLHSGLLSNLDAMLARQATTLAEEMVNGELPRPLPGTENQAVIVQVVDASGRVVTNSANIDGQARLFTFPGGAGTAVVRTVDVAEMSEPHRVAALAQDRPSGTVTIYVGSPTTEITRSVDELGGALVVGVPVLVLALAIVGWLLLGRALRPVDALRRQASGIPGADLHRRLDVPPRAMSWLVSPPRSTTCWTVSRPRRTGNVASSPTPLTNSETRWRPCGLGWRRLRALDLTRSSR